MTLLSRVSLLTNNFLSSLSLLPKQILKNEGQTEINLVINKRNQRIHFNLQNPRKFDFNQLKTMKTKEYVKKITV